MEYKDSIMEAVNAALLCTELLDRISEKYSAFSGVLLEYQPQLHAAAEQMRLIALRLEHLLEVGQPQGTPVDNSGLQEDLRQAHCKFTGLMDECAKRLRQRVNTPEECLRLAKAGDGHAMSGESFVYFENGTSVTVWEDELEDEESVEDAAKRKLSHCRKAWIDSPDESESEGENPFYDSQRTCYLSFEQGSMYGVTFWYWVSEEWPEIDSELAWDLRKKDCEELTIVAIVQGESE